MSFGFGVGDFVAVGALAFKLYNECYKIARGAPQEFRLLVNELTSLNGSLQILQQALKDPQSTLRQAGPERVVTVKNMESGIYDTLMRLDRFAKKYKILGSATEKKHYWTRFKWSIEHRDIDGLRAKLVYHNTMMNLLLTAAGNSSLQRIEASNAAIEKEMDSIKDFIMEATARPKKQAIVLPAISGVDNVVFKESLVASLMKNAEIFQPWSTIGINQWMESGKWWLQLAQMDLSTVLAPQQIVPPSAYANLIKASWILLDIIACHPQVPFLTATTQAEIRQLAAEIRVEHSRLCGIGAPLPDWKDVEIQNLEIWEDHTRGSLLRPRDHAQEGGYRTVEGGERVLFQKYATIRLQAHTARMPCMVSLLVQEDARAARILAQNQEGATILANLFDERVAISLIDHGVCFNNEMLGFRDTSDAKVLKCLLEATDFYLHDRRVQTARLVDLEAYALIHAVKDGRCPEAVNHLSNRLSLLVDAYQGAIQDDSVTVAVALADLYSNHRVQREPAVYNGPIPSQPLFDWAVHYEHPSLAKLLMQEQAAVRPWVITDCDIGLSPTDAYIGEQSKNLLKLIDAWKDKNTAYLILKSYHDVSKSTNRTVVALLYSAEEGLTQAACLLLQIIECDGDSYEKAIVEAVRRGCVAGRQDLIQALVLRAFGDKINDWIGLAVLKLTLGTAPDMLVDLTLRERPATRGAFMNGKTLGHLAHNYTRMDSTSVREHNERMLFTPLHKVIVNSLEARGLVDLFPYSTRRRDGVFSIRIHSSVAAPTIRTSCEASFGSLAKSLTGSHDGYKDFVLLSPVDISFGQSKGMQTNIKINIQVLFYACSNSNGPHEADSKLLESICQLFVDSFDQLRYLPFPSSPQWQKLPHTHLVEDVKNWISRGNKGDRRGYFSEHERDFRAMILSLLESRQP